MITPLARNTSDVFVPIFYQHPSSPSKNLSASILTLFSSTIFFLFFDRLFPLIQRLLPLPPISLRLLPLPATVIRYQSVEKSKVKVKAPKGPDLPNELFFLPRSFVQFAK